MGPAAVFNTLACPTFVELEVWGAQGSRVLPGKGAAQDFSAAGRGRQHHSSSELLFAHMRAKVFLLEVQGPGW